MRDRSFSTPLLRAVTGLLFASILAAPASWAGFTDPTLTLARATVVGGSSRLVVVHGVFPGDDMVQMSYPLQLLVRSLTDGTTYVRFDLANRGLTGNSPALLDGLDAADVPALLAGGQVSPTARIVGLGLERIDVVLPSGFPAGPAEVQIFVLEPGETNPVLSNPLTIQVPLS